MPRPERTDAARGPDPANGRLVRKTALKLARPSDLAFKKAKLDSGNKEHWIQLTFQLAWTVFGTRGPGAPKSWTKKRLRRLLADVRNIKIDDPRLSELKRCTQLVKEGKYKETATTLPGSCRNMTVRRYCLRRLGPFRPLFSPFRALLRH
jgi:hypothetical protein